MNSILVTEAGMTNSRNEEQARKAINPILATEAGMTNLRNEEQAQKVSLPIPVTEDGISNSRKEEQLLNALLQITAVPFFTLYSSISFGTSNNLKPSLLYFTPYSSTIASAKSSTVTFVESSISGIITGIYSGLAILNNLKEILLSSFLA